MPVIRRVFGIVSLCAGFGLLSLRPVLGGAPAAPESLSLFTPEVIAAGEVVTVSVLDDQNRRIPDAQISLELNGVQVSGVVSETDAHGRHRLRVPDWVFGMGGLAFIASSGGASARSTVPLTPPPSNPGAGAPPQINSCFPSQAVTGRPLTIQGDHFGGDADRVTVRFGEQVVPPENILTASDNMVTVVPPSRFSTGRQPLTVAVDRDFVAPLRSAPFGAYLIRPEIQLDKNLLQPGERTRGSLILHGAPPGVSIPCDLSPSGPNVTMSPAGRVETTTGRIDFQVTGVTPGHFDVRAVAGAQARDLPPDYPAPQTIDDLTQMKDRMHLPPGTLNLLDPILTRCHDAWAQNDGAKAADALRDFQRRVTDTKGKGVTDNQAALLQFGAATLLHQLFSSGMAKPPSGTGTLETVTQQFRQTDSNNDGTPEPVITLIFPPSLGGGSAKAHLEGTFTYSYDARSNVIRIERAEATVSSVAVPCDRNGEGKNEPCDTGPITFTLTNDGFSAADITANGAPNRGYFDPASGAARVTWGIEATCPLFTELGIPPVKLLLPETGRFDPATKTFAMVGIGRVVSGPFAGMMVANCCLWCKACTVACGGCTNDGGVCSGGGTKSCSGGECDKKCKGHATVSCPGCGGRGCSCAWGACGC